jgi:hypothetical protein
MVYNSVEVQNSMLENAANAASDIVKSENSAKSFGRDMLRLVRGDTGNGETHDLDTLKRLTMERIKFWTGSAANGAIVKTKFKGWFTRLSKVNGAWDVLTDDIKTGLLAGEVSFQTTYNAILKAEKEADKAATEAEAASKAAEAGKTLGDDEKEPVAPNVNADAINAVIALVGTDLDETSSAAMATLFDAIDAYRALIAETAIEA